MVSGNVDELLKSLDTDYAFMKKQLPVLRGNLRSPALTTEQLESGAKMQIDSEFMQKLTLKESLKGGKAALKYKANDDFQAAFASMGNSLNASIVAVLETIKTQAPRIKVYTDVTGIAWNHRKDDSVEAFNNIMIAVLTANQETSGAYISLKGKMQTIGEKIKPLMGLPSNITKEISALHTAVTKFNTVSTSVEFDKLFTLNGRKDNWVEQNRGADPPEVTLPTTLILPLAVAAGHSEPVRKLYWAQWLTMLDSLKLATQALLYYQKLGLDLTTPQFGGKIPFYSGTKPLKTITLIAEARDALVNRLVYTLRASTLLGGGQSPDHRAVADAIQFSLTTPVTIVDKDEINHNIAYIGDVIAKLMPLHGLLP